MDFEALYREHITAVTRYALSRADPDSAKDAVAETFTVAWRRLADIPSDNSLAWLLLVARRTLADQRRSRQRESALHDRIIGWTDETVVEDHGRAVTEQAVIAAALARLNPADQELLILIAWDGLSAAEAAIVCGCSTATFSVRLHRARRRFRAALADVDPAPDAECDQPSLSGPYRRLPNALEAT